jgi:hypothetical protein
MTGMSALSHEWHDMTVCTVVEIWMCVHGNGYTDCTVLYCIALHMHVEIRVPTLYALTKDKF